MLAPGSSFTSGQRLNALASAGPTAVKINGAMGFDASGNLLIDTNAPAGTSRDQGIAISALNCVYGTTTKSATDSFVNGLRIASTGALVYVQAAISVVANGNPLDSAGALCIA